MLEMVQSWLSTLAIVIGGLWALWRFVLQREAHAKIEFGLDLHVLGRVRNDVLVNVIAVVTNRGAVRHYLYDFWFMLNTLKTTDLIEFGGDNIDRQIKFNCDTERRYWIAEQPLRRYWIAEQPGKYFIDPGVTQRYSHVTKIPASAAFVQVYGRFRYPESRFRYSKTGDPYHPAQNAFALPALTKTDYSRLTIR